MGGLFAQPLDSEQHPLGRRRHFEPRGDLVIGHGSDGHRQRLDHGIAEHERRLAHNQRMALQVKNIARLNTADREAIRARAESIRQNGGKPSDAGAGLLF